MNTPVPASAEQDVALGDVLLAMDVVDTLRHEQRVVSEALGAEAREQALVERVRRAYAAQGIEVSDRLIAEGVARLKEQQFDYAPPPAGLKTSLAIAWVNRGRIGTGLAAVAILAAIVGAGWYGFVELPKARAQAALVAETDAGIAAAARSLDALQARRSALESGLEAARGAATPDAARLAIAGQLRDAETALAEAGNALSRAATLEQADRNPDPDDRPMAAARSERLAEQRARLADAELALARGDEALAAIDTLRALPETIARLRDEGLAVAATATARQRVAREAEAALAALAVGDAAAAQRGAAALRDSLALLQRELTVRIVSRPGVLSGVIRAPNDNPRASNYYLVVEAVDASGSPVRLPVTSEEDDSTRTVSLWAVRVDEATFDRVRRDKQDDGVIQNARVGTKPRGHVDIDWSIRRAGGFIHRWDDPR